MTRHVPVLQKLTYLKPGNRINKGWTEESPRPREWEDLYRHRWGHDKIVRSTHGVNCTGSCSWKIYVKDGIITWETQQTDYPSLGPNFPEYEPRGCPRGASYSWYTYSPVRVRYPYVREELLTFWRKERDAGHDPITAWENIVADREKVRQYQKARGKGGLIRSNWNEVTEMIAASMIHTIKTYGPDRITGFSPIPAAILSLIFGDKKEPRVKTSVTAQFKQVYNNDKTWLFSLFYFITFGSFVAFTVYLPNFLVAQFDLTKVDAGLRTAGFIVLATVLRPVGGWLSDRINPYKVLMFVFTGMTIAGVALSFLPTILLYTFGCLLVALCAGIGNGAIFKLVPLHFHRQAGFVNGLVAAFGGLGGFFPPFILTIIHSMTGDYAIGFMALSEFAFASLVVCIWLFFEERLQLSDLIIHSTREGIMITDPNGVIRSVNASFTALTGFTSKDAIGRTPSILSSGKHDKAFYHAMWESITDKGYWEGEIWNKRKDGEVYLEWITITAIKGESDETKYYAGMFNDVTNSQNLGRA